MATTGGTQVEPSTGDDSAGFVPNPDAGGSFPTGSCFGRRAVGYFTLVHASETQPAPACDPQPLQCGADPVGTWSVAGHCGLDDYPNLFENSCPSPSSTTTVVDSQVSGTRTFGPDGLYSFDLDLTLQVRIELDTQQCYGQTCEEFIASYRGSLDLDCAPQGESCTCMWTRSSQSVVNGTYEVTTDGLVVTADGSTSEPVAFCVEPDGLTTWRPLHQRRFGEWACSDAEDCEAFAAQNLPDGGEYEWRCVEPDPGSALAPLEIAPVNAGRAMTL